MVNYNTQMPGWHCTVYQLPLQSFRRPDSHSAVFCR